MSLRELRWGNGGGKRSEVLMALVDVAVMTTMMVSEYSAFGQWRYRNGSGIRDESWRTSWEGVRSVREAVYTYPRRGIKNRLLD